MPIELKTPHRLPNAEAKVEKTTPMKPNVARIFDELAGRVGRHKFDMWFGHTNMRLSEDRLAISCNSQFVAKWIQANFEDDLRVAAANALGRTVRVDVFVAADPAASADDGQRQTAKPSPQESANGSGTRQTPGAPTDVNGNGNGHEGNGTKNADGSVAAGGAAPARRQAALRRLDDFVVGSCNRLAYSTACRLAQDADARCISPLFIHGDCGVGKTHLLQGVCERYIALTGRSQQVRYVTGEQFTNEYITAIRNNTIDTFRQRVRKLDVLAIDDVHFLSNKVRTQSEFLYTLDAIDLSGARVVLASDNHPHHIKRFSQALVSRFLSGMVVKIERPDRETRVELIKRLAASRGLQIAEQAIDVIAANCVGSVREIEGAMTKLAAYGSLMNGHHHHTGNGNGNGHVNGNGNGSAGNSHVNASKPEHEIGLVLAEKIFREQPWQTVQIVRMNAVIDAVCTKLGVAKSDLMGSGRHRRIVVARALVAYLGRELTTHSFPEIAQSLGRTNHSTIHTADQRFRKQLAANETITLSGGTSAGEDEVCLKDLAEQLRRDITEQRH